MILQPAKEQAKIICNFIFDTKFFGLFYTGGHILNCKLHFKLHFKLTF